MNKIIWTGDRFKSNSLELEEAKCEVLSVENKRLHEFMRACDLPINGYSYDADWNIFTHRKSQDGELVFFPITDEGAGFNICFHLGAYAIASVNLGQELEICAYSFKASLHPLLFEALEKWFRDRRPKEVDKQCVYYSGSRELKCVVNPSLPCKGCVEASMGFNENLFVWNHSGLPPIDCSKLKPYIVVDLGGGRDITAEIQDFEINEATGISNIHLKNKPELREAIAQLREGGIRAFGIPVVQLGDEPVSSVSISYEYSNANTSEPVDEISARSGIWAQLRGMQVYPQPHRMQIPQKLYGIKEELE